MDLATILWEGVRPVKPDQLVLFMKMRKPTYPKGLGATRCIREPFHLSIQYFRRICCTERKWYSLVHEDM